MNEPAEPEILFPGARVILVETTHPGNIGAAARAMKNMGLTELVLVNPFDFPNQEALTRAASAEDVVASAKVFQTVEEAIADCQLVIGTSARDRRIPWPMLDPKGCGRKVVQTVSAGLKVGLLFGRESRGLKNEELQQCHFHVNIPTGKAYSSLNLAMAVQVITYEIRVASMLDEGPVFDVEAPPATSDEMEHFYTHLENVLRDIQFLDPDNPRHLMRRMRRLFIRARPDKNEVNILRGILTAIDRTRRDDDK